MPKTLEQAGDKALEKLKEANDEFDSLADKELDGAKSSKYTGLMLVGGVVAIILLVLLAIELS